MMSGVSCSCRTWRSCQTIIVSSTVPIPPGTTTNASETRTKWWSREKNVRCSKAWVTNGLTSCSKGKSTRMPTEARSGSDPGHPSPLVRRLHQPGPAAGDDVAAEARQLGGEVADGRVAPVAGSVRAEPKMVTR